jgi:hypothetical protein
MMSRQLDQGVDRARGNILITSLGLLLMMTFLSIGLFYRVEKEFLIESSTHDQADTFNAAESGLQMGLFWLEQVAQQTNYPDVGMIPALQVPSLVDGVAMSVAVANGCHGYSRFNTMDMGAGTTFSNTPSTDLSAPLDSSLRLLSVAPIGVNGCTLLTIPLDASLTTPQKLGDTQFDFYVEALPRETVQTPGEQVGVSTIYGYSGEGVSYPYRIRAVGRHHPQGGTPFDSTDAAEAQFDVRSLLDLWVHYEN